VEQAQEMKTSDKPHPGRITGTTLRRPRGCGKAKVQEARARLPFGR